VDGVCSPITHTWSVACAALNMELQPIEALGVVDVAWLPQDEKPPLLPTAIETSPSLLPRSCQVKR
jgi:hypothetical protein